MKEIEGRDLQLWSIGVLLLLVMTAGFAFTWLPRGDSVVIDSRVLSTVLYGLISLIVLYNVYVLMQRRGLRVARADLVRQLMRAEAAEHMAMTDSLTGLFNRRYLEHALTTEAKRVSRTGESLSILMFDLDNFGAMNKRFGHLEGDKILRQFAQLLLAAFRQTDTVARFGGDEFVVLLTEATLEQAELARARLLRSAELWNSERALEGREILVTSGLAEYAENEPVEDTLRRADETLRQSKAAHA
jgi:diguanylate cyclase (GGDEF)-like protein